MLVNQSIKSLRDYQAQNARRLEELNQAVQTLKKSEMTASLRCSKLQKKKKLKKKKEKERLKMCKLLEQIK